MSSLFLCVTINNTMRAKEFIIEYAVSAIPAISVSNPCSKCGGAGNITDGEKTQTCPICSGTGSEPENPEDSDPQQGYASDSDGKMNQADTLWAVGKF